MSNKLKSCPFCGNTNILVYEEEGKFGFTEWIVECDSHYCACQPTAHDTYQTKAEAIEAWNTRAERTCKAEQDYDAMDNGIPDCRIWKCSCGESFPFWRGLNPCFCPNCGGKVIDDEG